MNFMHTPIYAVERNLMSGQPEYNSCLQKSLNKMNPCCIFSSLLPRAAYIHISSHSKWSVIDIISVTQQESITLTSSFHQSIAYSLVSLKTNIHLCDIIRFSVTYKNIRVFRNQLSDMRIN